MGADPPPDPLLNVVYRRPAPERIALVTDAGAAPAMVLLSEGFHPWWRATVDAAPAPVLRAQTTLMAIPVGPGRHEIELRLRRPLVVATRAGVSALARVRLLRGPLGYGVPRVSVGGVRVGATFLAHPPGEEPIVRSERARLELRIGSSGDDDRPGAHGLEPRDEGQP